MHESESTRTLLAKASKLNMYIHNIHLHIFFIKLIPGKGGGGNSYMKQTGMLVVSLRV